MSPTIPAPTAAATSSRNGLTAGRAGKPGDELVPVCVAVDLVVVAVDDFVVCLVVELTVLLIVVDTEVVLVTVFVDTEVAVEVVVV